APPLSSTRSPPKPSPTTSHGPMGSSTPLSKRKPRSNASRSTLSSTLAIPNVAAAPPVSVAGNTGGPLTVGLVTSIRTVRSSAAVVLPAWSRIMKVIVKYASVAAGEVTVSTPTAEVRTPPEKLPTPPGATLVPKVWITARMPVSGRRRTHSASERTSTDQAAPSLTTPTSGPVGSPSSGSSWSTPYGSL